MTIGLLLAAGASRRFGPKDKLLAAYRRRPLVLHMAQELRAITSECYAVTSSERVATLLSSLGYHILRCREGQPQSESLKTGLAALADARSEILITLGDMPEITREDLQKLANGPAPACACAGTDTPIMPPVLIAPSDIARLMKVTGDQGAGRILRDDPQLRRVILPEEHLRDVDHPHDLIA